MEKKLFYCYSYPLKEFLNNNGEKYFTKGFHDKTLKKFWCFYGTEELNSLLVTWRSRKQ